MPANPPRARGVLAEIEALHRAVDRAVAPLARRHAARLQCRAGCTDCCIDGITVFEVETERIRRRHSDLLTAGRPGPAGACAFLDGDGNCRIYDSRPYVCRTQGLPLRWLDRQDGRTVERRDICPLNEQEGSPVEHLAAEDCWTLGSFESRLRALQDESGRRSARVALRDLFAKHENTGEGT